MLRWDSGGVTAFATDYHSAFCSGGVLVAVTQPEKQQQAMLTTLRVLLEPRKNDPNIWVATCLETGFVATGLGYDEI